MEHILSATSQAPNRVHGTFRNKSCIPWLWNPLQCALRKRNPDLPFTSLFRQSLHNCCWLWPWIATVTSSLKLTSAVNQEENVLVQSTLLVFCANPATAMYFDILSILQTYNQMLYSSWVGQIEMPKTCQQFPAAQPSTKVSLNCDECEHFSNTRGLTLLYTPYLHSILVGCSSLWQNTLFCLSVCSVCCFRLVGGLVFFLVFCFSFLFCFAEHLDTTMISSIHHDFMTRDFSLTL